MLAHKLALRKGPQPGFEFASEGSDPMASQKSDRSRLAISEMPAAFEAELQAGTMTEDALGDAEGKMKDKKASKLEGEVQRTKSFGRPKSNELVEALQESDEDLAESPRSGAKTGHTGSRKPILSETVERHTED